MPWAVDTPWWEHAAIYSGGTPRMAAMDDPAEVVDAIVELCPDPHEELAVGWKAKASCGSHKLTPNLSDGSMRRFVPDFDGVDHQRTAPRAPHPSSE